MKRPPITLNPHWFTMAARADARLARNRAEFRRWRCALFPLTTAVHP